MTRRAVMARWRKGFPFLSDRDQHNPCHPQFRKDLEQFTYPVARSSSAFAAHRANGQERFLELVPLWSNATSHRSALGCSPLILTASLLGEPSSHLRDVAEPAGKLPRRLPHGELKVPPQIADDGKRIPEALVPPSGHVPGRHGLSAGRVEGEAVGDVDREEWLRKPVLVRGRDDPRLNNPSEIIPETRPRPRPGDFHHFDEEKGERVTDQLHARLAQDPRSVCQVVPIGEAPKLG